MKSRKIISVGLLLLTSTFLFTGCGTTKETPAAGVSISGAENKTLGFTYLYDLGNGYKLYADNFTQIVYLKYDYCGGNGATSVGSSTLTPYISENGNYYKINTKTRVIEELIVNKNVVEDTTIKDDATSTEGSSSTNQKQDIEDILNENSQKNENINNQQSQGTQEQKQSQEPQATETSTEN